MHGGVELSFSTPSQRLEQEQVFILRDSMTEVIEEIPLKKLQGGGTLTRRTPLHLTEWYVYATNSRFHRIKNSCK